MRAKAFAPRFCLAKRHNNFIRSPLSKANVDSVQEDQKKLPWKNIRRFVFDWVISLALFVAAIALGTFLFLVGASAIGFLAYSDRPGPGWMRSGSFSWAEISFFLGWEQLLILYFLPFAGAALFPFARTLGWLSSPRWLVRVFGALFSGFAGFLSVAAAGWYIAVSEYPVYAAGLCGIVYGALILPLFCKRPEAGGRTWKHWLGIGTSILGFAALISYPLWAALLNQQISSWVRGLGIYPA
jgi:hypothetical protein